MIVEENTKQSRSAEVSQNASAIVWVVLATCAAIALVVVWPEAYVFRVSQLTFDAWEVANGEAIPLESYEIGFDRLEVFRWYRFLAWSLAGMLGGCLVHAIAALFGSRDWSYLSSVLAFGGALLGLMIGDDMLPPIVDPVYGEGGLRLFPWWIENLIPAMVWAAMIGGIMFPIRFLLGMAFAYRVQMHDEKEVQ